ncbi:Uncharacterised protein [Vibrio cholerae]|nr:Uncharacterised protein [Vibrio cholerae]
MRVKWLKFKTAMKPWKSLKSCRQNIAKKNKLCNPKSLS